MQATFSTDPDINAGKSRRSSISVSLIVFDKIRYRHLEYEFCNGVHTKFCGGNGLLGYSVLSM